MRKAPRYTAWAGRSVRGPPSSRRVVRAKLTEAGAALLSAIDEPLVALHRRQLGHLPSSELETLLELLAKARGD